MEKEQKVLLFAYTTKEDGHKTVYMVFGKFEAKQIKDSDLLYPEFSDLSFFLGSLASGSSANGMISCNTPLKVSNANEFARDVCAKYTQNDFNYHFLMVYSVLRKLLDNVSSKYVKVREYEPLPLNILNSHMCLMELSLVTDKYAFYTYEDEYLMMDVYSRHVLKNSATTQFNFDESLDNIATGVEKAYWICPEHGFDLDFPRGQKKLMGFYIINEKGDKVYHEFYGKFTKESRVSTNWSTHENFSWVCPEFDESSLIRIESGFVNESPRYNLEAIKRAFSGYTKRSGFYRFVYICDELKELADNITAKKLDINGSKLPEFMLDDELYMLQLTYADEGFIHYENGRVIDIFDAVRGVQMFQEEFKYEETRLSGNNLVQHNGEAFYEIDTDTRLQLAIARRNYQEQEEDDDLSDAEIEERKRADAVIAQYFANNMFLDEIEEAERGLPDLPF